MDAMTHDIALLDGRMDGWMEALSKSRVRLACARASELTQKQSGQKLETGEAGEEKRMSAPAPPSPLLSPFFSCFSFIF